MNDRICVCATVHMHILDFFKIEKPVLISTKMTMMRGGLRPGANKESYVVLNI